MQVATQELLYERIADHVTALIDRGALGPGDRLPSVRRLSRQQRVSISTVVQAYQALEARGLVEARPQSGHFVRPRRAQALAEPRPPRPITTASRASTSEIVARVYGAVRDPKLVQLGAAVPSPELLPTDKLNRMMALLAREAGGVGVAYDVPPGYPRLRRAVARRSPDWGCALSPDDLVTTVGCAEALHLALRAVLKPGDAVAVESPMYYGLLQLFESLDLRVCEVPANPRTGMDLFELEEVLRSCNVKACVATPNFNNPGGTLMPDEDKDKLVGLLARRDIPLIEDDIYGDLGFPSLAPERPRPAKAFDKKGLVILCSSFSKTLAPGYRVGWVAPGRFRDRVERLKFAQSVATPTLPQMAVAEFLETGGYDHHLRQLRRRLAANVARFREAVAKYFPSGTRVSRPAGGYVLWIELPDGKSGLDVHAAALERGISIAPGPIFSARPRFGSFIRLNFGQSWSDTIDRAIATLGRLTHDLD